METDKMKAIDFISNPKHTFVTFKPININQDKFATDVIFTGYRDLFCTITELLKVASAACEVDSEASPVVRLLDLIYNLIPIQEGELLDFLYMQYLESIKSEEQ
jgi:hypothetical protein